MIERLFSFKYAYRNESVAKLFARMKVRCRYSGKCDGAPFFGRRPWESTHAFIQAAET
jgi:hypothetical protein